MKDKELFKGFDVEKYLEKKPEYDKYAIEQGWATKQELAQHPSSIWNKNDWQKAKQSMDDSVKLWVSAIERKLTPDNPEVQKLTEQLYDWIKNAWSHNKPKAIGATKEQFIGLGQMYCENPDFRQMWDNYHPQLAEFLAHAMKVYAEKNLK